MTNEEIIKALECCGQHRECCYCNSVEECGNKRILTKATLDLINRQKAEIERLKAGVNVELENYASEYDSKIKSEAIKEFAEKLKKKIGDSHFQNYGLAILEIQDLVKEMVGK